MSQEDVIKLLSKNKSEWFSLKQLLDLLKINKSSLISNLNKLKESNEIDIRTFQTCGIGRKTGNFVKYYKFKETDDIFEDIVLEYNCLKENDKRFEQASQRGLQNFMILKYLKKIIENQKEIKK